MQRIIDLRSDTVTHPTPAMREAMYRAEVGDDVMGEDPTVNRLQEMAAERMGKEAALFVASGTMGNLICILAQCGRGDEVIMGDKAHTFLFEAGGPSVLGGVHVRTVRNRDDGTVDPAEVEAAVRPDNVHFPRSRLVVLENTHNRCGGVVLTRAQMDPVIAVARKHNLHAHLDGARIFNAAVALGVDARTLAEPFDTVSFCLSKGLSAPVGSLVCGSREFVREATRLRKVLGGGMRQAGIIAAAGIVALEQMVDRLADDHANARRLAEGLAEMGVFDIRLERVQSNILIFGLAADRFTPQQLVARCAQDGLKFQAIEGGQFRMVTHYGIEREDIDAALLILKRVVRELSRV
ncbi:MAG: low-specificity L-threonine aldolase [Anaerolineae bacterium]|nr:low-specificity L-threonine aldolase [Anaerolineae bacterium]